ncbi:MAG: GAF domain-containing protein, partial [Candidatus Latescibacteria bacterium]|nr:GAF domain-containing protein [bacterium]MBD3425323.1 GAF domain-containing protein [Candidatus Latescibacterota bacterium]
LADIGGLALLIISPAAIGSSGGAAGQRGMTGPSRRLQDLLGSIASAEQLADKYKLITESVRKQYRADFVILRTSPSAEGGYGIRACAGECQENLYEMTGLNSRKDYASYFEDTCGGSEGYALSRGELGEDSPLFVPSQISWSAESIYIYPVRDAGGVESFFTVGFFGHDIRLDEKFLVSCSELVRQLNRYEAQRENSHRLEAHLLQCKHELEGANQLKSNFLSIVSHELKTPLTSIKAYAETLVENISTLERETVAEFLNVMSEENDKVIKLVDNILDYSTMENGQLRYRKELCNITEIIQNVYSEFREKMLSEEVSCDLRLPASEVFVEADSSMIGQLLSNLLANSIKFTPAGGSVKVALEEEASAVRILVQDTGQGIPEDQLETVFERFHQVDASNTREHGGSGLGLAICKDIVEWHDGRIWVENIKEAGARFTVLLPIRDTVVRNSSTAGIVGATRFNRERFLSLIVETLAGFLQARKTSIMALDEDEGVLRVVAAKGMDPEFVQNTKVRVGERIAGKVFEEGKAAHINDIEENDQFRMANNSAYYGTHSFISAPLMYRGEVVGVVNVSDHVEGKEFSPFDRKVLEALGGVLVNMLRKLENYERVSENFNNLREAMRTILDFRESVGSKNIALYSRMAVNIGEKIGLDEESLTALQLGMNLYDVGMMLVPRGIRGKREKLSEEEWEKLREHTNAGYSLLSPMELDARIMEMIRSHHEKYSGGGYPDGTAATDTYVGARVIQMVDSFRALLSQGPYRRSYSVDEAVEEIRRGVGDKFDPDIWEAFRNVIEEFRESGEITELDSFRGYLSEVQSEKSDNREKVKEKV